MPLNEFDIPEIPELFKVTGVRKFETIIGLPPDQPPSEPPIESNPYCVMLIISFSWLTMYVFVHNLPNLIF